MLKPQSAENPLPNPYPARRNRVETVKPQTYNSPPLPHNGGYDEDTGNCNFDNYVYNNNNNEMLMMMILTKPFDDYDDDD